MVRKAVIPVAGLGTRMLPLTAAVPKALLPLADCTGRLRAVIQFIVEEALRVADEAAIVASPGQAQPLRRYFDAARTDMPDLPQRIRYVEQPLAAGFGDAVARAKDFVGGESFLLMLGDHVYRPDAGDRPAAVQVAQAFAAAGEPSAMVGMQDVAESELCRVGAARGEHLGGRLYRCTDFVEKPRVDVARTRLVTPGLPPGRYLAHCGIYLFSAEIFDCLDELAAGPGGKEIELADAQKLLLSRRPEGYLLCRIAGRAYDVGSPQGYAAAFDAMRLP